MPRSNFYHFLLVEIAHYPTWDMGNYECDICVLIAQWGSEGCELINLFIFIYLFYYL